MAGRLSMATRREVVTAIRERYGAATRAEKGRILDELVAVAGYHRKHAIRVLGRREAAITPDRARRGRAYGEDDRATLIALWGGVGPAVLEAAEAADPDPAAGAGAARPDLRGRRSAPSPAGSEPGDHGSPPVRGPGDRARRAATAGRVQLGGAADRPGAHVWRLERPAAGLRGGRSRGARRHVGGRELRADGGADRHRNGLDRVRADPDPGKRACPRGARTGTRIVPRSRSRASTSTTTARS